MAQQATTKYYGPYTETYGEYTFGLERLYSIRDELEPLHLNQWYETEARYTDSDFKPDYDSAAVVEQGLRLLSFTVRDGADKIVGNAVFTVGEHYLMGGRLAATEVTFFLVRECRTGWLAVRFIQFMTRFLKDCAIDFVYMGDKSAVGGKNLESIFRRCGFLPTGTNYVMEL